MGRRRDLSRPPLPVAFFDLNGDGRQETLIANDDATVGIYDGSERRTSSSTLEKILLSDTSNPVEDVVVVVVCDDSSRDFCPAVEVVTLQRRRIENAIIHWRRRRRETTKTFVYVELFIQSIESGDISPPVNTGRTYNIVGVEERV